MKEKGKKKTIWFVAKAKKTLMIEKKTLLKDFFDKKQSK